MAGVKLSDGNYFLNALCSELLGSPPPASRYRELVPYDPTRNCVCAYSEPVRIEGMRVWLSRRDMPGRSDYTPTRTMELDGATDVLAGKLVERQCAAISQWRRRNREWPRCEHGGLDIVWLASNGGLRGYFACTAAGVYPNPIRIYARNKLHAGVPPSEASGVRAPCGFCGDGGPPPNDGQRRLSLADVSVVAECPIGKPK